MLENVIKRTFGELNNIFQGEFNMILSQESTIVFPFVHFFGVTFLSAAEFEEPKIDISGKGLSIQPVSCFLRP